jgi:hypothetical protein
MEGTSEKLNLELTGTGTTTQNMTLIGKTYGQPGT